MKINEIIREKRKALSLTQEQIADFLGVSTPAVSKWEKGAAYPDITLLPALARLLKTDLNTLLSFQEDLTDIEIENFVTSVFKQTMYTEFENKLYSLKNEQELTPEILASTYAQLLKKYYGPQIVYDDLAQIEWTRLGKLYRWSYYPYKYATGLLIASAVVHSLNQKSLSKEGYLSFLASGSSLYSLDLLKMIHIDFSNTQIIEEGFKVMEQDIRNFESLLRKKSE